VIAGSLAAYAVVIGGGGKLISAYGFGMVSYHRASIGLQPPLGYAGPTIPDGARDIHIEQTGWLDPYLVLRFTADRPAVDSFLASLKLEWQDGVQLPEGAAFMSAFFDNPRSFFYDVRWIEHGQHSAQTRRTENGTTHGQFAAVDRDKMTVYYMVW
jgi:hypothetical protein